MKRRNKWLFIPLVLALFGLISLNRQNVFLQNLVTQTSSSQENAAYKAGAEVYKKKTVQLFAGTLFFGMNVTNQRFLGHCSVKNECRIVNDISNADAVLFHGPDFRRFPNDLRPDQIAVLWYLESPISFALYQDYAGRINWTMTYRRDSDVPLPYGRFKMRQTPMEFEFDDLWDSKNKSTIWLISNCAYRNGRMKLGKVLKAHGLQIDVFGTCGENTPNNCDGVGKQSDRCVAELFMPYKFAISFENSLCKDYITEKFYEVLQKRYVVPIVMQRERYEKIGAPSDSFIAVDDFKNIAELIDFLHRLEKDKEAYLKYHIWRENFIVESDYFELEDTGFCALCKKIMKQDYSSKSYPNPREWHSTDVCEEPQDAFVKRYIDGVDST